MTRFPIDGTGRLASEREHPTTLLTGPASGDLAGSYPAPTVATVNGHAASSVVSASPQSIGTPRLTVGPTAPASPTINDLWLSTSRQDAKVSPSPLDRSLALGPSGSGWDVGSVQEPSVWDDGTQLNMLYTGTGVSFASPRLGWATCPYGSDPTKAASWTKYVSNPILGGGNGGEAGDIAHAKAYFEAGTLYIFYVAAAGGPVKVASGADPAHLTLVGTALTAQGSATSYSNPRVFKRGTGDYVMTFTATGGPVQFQAGYATASVRTGPYTLQTFPISSLNPVTSAAATDGPALALEGATYVGWYHSSHTVSGNLPDDIWRATSTDLVNWTILDQGYPVLRRAGQYEGDQVSDVFLFTTPSGLDLAFWSAMDNVSDAGHVMCAPLSPVLKRYTGSSWAAVVPSSDGGYAHGAQALNAIFGRATQPGALAIGVDHTGLAAQSTTQDQIAIGTPNQPVYLGSDLHLNTATNGIVLDRADLGQKITFHYGTNGSGAALEDGTVLGFSGALIVGRQAVNVQLGSPFGTIPVMVPHIPTADPAVSGQLYSDGVPSAGVPKALMVSGG